MTMKHHRFPEWMKRVDRKISNSVVMEGYRWLDHWGTINENGVDVLVSEPYSLHGKAAHDLLSFIERTECDVLVDNRGEYSDSVIRIRVYPPRHENEHRYRSQQENYADSITAFVYGLKDPRDDLFRYVGQTTNVKKRFKQHMAGSVDGSPEKRQWISELKLKGMEPKCEVLEGCNLAYAKKVEKKWINRMRAEGHPLTNGEYGKSVNSSPPQWVDLADTLQQIRSLMFQAMRQSREVAPNNDSGVKKLMSAMQTIDSARCRFESLLYRLRGREGDSDDLFFGGQWRDVG